jgi:hypothetical protein
MRFWITILLFSVALNYSIAQQSTSSEEKNAQQNSKNFTLSPTSTELLYSSKNLMAGFLYPNPANNIVMLDYQMGDPNISAKIVIHNVLGSMVGEYPMSPYEERLKITTQQLQPGVYFYTLYVNNENFVTKKMIIKR